MNKSREIRDNFFENIEDTLNRVHKKGKIFLLEDFNPRIGKIRIQGGMQRFNEDVIINNANS